MKSTEPVLFTSDVHMARKNMGGGVTNHTGTLHVTFTGNFRECMVAIRDASYLFSQH